MLRKTLGVLAILILTGGGTAFSAGWPSWFSRPSQPACTHCGSAGGWVDESPLYPELTHWTLEPSQCRQLHGQSGHHRRGAEVQYFPPLPYSHRAVGYAGPGQTGAQVPPPPVATIP
jgi:hypothetical protein